MGSFPRLEPRATFTETPVGKVLWGWVLPSGVDNPEASLAGLSIAAAMHTCCREDDSDPAVCSLPGPPKAFSEMLKHQVMS